RSSSPAAPSGQIRIAGPPTIIGNAPKEPCTMPRRRRRPRRTNKLRILLLVGITLAVALWYLSHRQPTAPGEVVARVLFSETANCSPQERLLVAGVMKNRIANPAFGDSPSLQAVVLQRGAFSCINDPGNANWQRTGHLSQLTSREHSIYQQCLALSH